MPLNQDSSSSISVFNEFIMRAVAARPRFTLIYCISACNMFIQPTVALMWHWSVVFPTLLSLLEIYLVCFIYLLIYYLIWFVKRVEKYWAKFCKYYFMLVLVSWRCNYYFPQTSQLMFLILIFHAWWRWPIKCFIFMSLTMKKKQNILASVLHANKSASMNKENKWKP